MNRLAAIIENFFWTIVVVFVAIIVGFALLGWLRDTFPNNIVGKFATWTARHAEPQ